MPKVVQKFGGTSVATTDKIKAAARKAIRAQKEGNQVVMVVSAMGKNTDTLVGLAAEISDRPPAREMDMLLSTGEQVSVALMAMAIIEMGSKAVSLTGGQIGIKTDNIHTKARIKSISTKRMQDLLDDENIVIAAGFQGIDDDFNITTLGRGGSDTTAVALAAVLNASCEIYTDVDGVYTTDPRVVPEARKVTRISYDEMLELASVGAGVMHSRSIEFAKKFGVPIHVRSSLSDGTGTMIVAEPEVRSRPVSGVALTKNEARITISQVPDVPGTSHVIFSSIAAKHVTVDMIVQNIGRDGKADISFTVPQGELAVTLEALEATKQQLREFRISHDDQVAKVSVVGLGMEHQPGVADRMFRCLAQAGINLQMITTSEIKISCLVARDQAVDALRCVHDEFHLADEPEDFEQTQLTTSQADAVDVVTQLQDGMEELLIDGIDLDESQGRITIHQLQDQPGVAAEIFGEIGKQGIVVDMIVQSHLESGAGAISFTVPSADVAQAADTLQAIASVTDNEITSSPQVAKLSVSGIGLRSHTGVAIRMFEALSHEGINVKLISTSEVRVNVLVDGEQGKAALVCLQEAFTDVLR